MEWPSSKFPCSIPSRIGKHSPLNWNGQASDTMYIVVVITYIHMYILRSSKMLIKMRFMQQSCELLRVELIVIKWTMKTKTYSMHHVCIYPYLVNTIHIREKKANSLTRTDCVLFTILISAQCAHRMFGCIWQWQYGLIGTFCSIIQNSFDKSYFVYFNVGPLILHTIWRPNPTRLSEWSTIFTKNGNMNILPSKLGWCSLADVLGLVG